jgi:hypothetical protein
MVPELSPDDLAAQWARAFRGNTVAAEMISAFADIRPLRASESPDVAEARVARSLRSSRSSPGD